MSAKPKLIEQKRATYQQIADEMGKDVRTVVRWARMEGFPENPTVESVSAWSGSRRGPTRALDELRAEKLHRETRLLDLKIEREEGKTVLVAEVREMLGKMSAKHAQLLRMKYDTELPARLAGKDIVASRAEIIATTDEVCDVVNDGLTRWNPDS